MGDALDFDTLIDYALDNRLHGLIAEVSVGAAVPAFEQPCWDCGELRFFRQVCRPRLGGFALGEWFEQCAVTHLTRGAPPVCPAHTPKEDR